MTEQVTAQVILRAPDGSSILDSHGPVTAETIDKYGASQEAIEKTSRKLKELGFKVVSSNPTTLTITGDKDLFEHVFKTTIETQSTQMMSSIPESPEIRYYRATEPFNIPAELSSEISDVALPAPPQLYL